MILRFIGLFLLLSVSLSSFAQSGYDLWLRYNPISDSDLRQAYLERFESLYVDNSKPATSLIIKGEIAKAFESMLNEVPEPTTAEKASLVISTIDQLPLNLRRSLEKDVESLNEEGYVITTIEAQTIITSKTMVGALYGTYHLLRLMQMHEPLSDLAINEQPKLDVRILNHWDNLDGHVERGYSGRSIFNWHTLPDYIDPRYHDYARANASIGINGTVVINVNSNAQILTPQYIEKVKALADVFRPYGIKIYLTARFSAPMELDKLPTADPLDEQVITWWQKKVDEIYAAIPDFGGFLVKANSEGQPGPYNFGRNHADGANMLAKAVKPHGGIVMWRAFVYSEDNPDDRAKQAYDQFVPLDGQFDDNVLVQVKNGAIDFQPREPFHPMFGAMPKTPLMMEFQITQEYLGFSTHLVYMPKLFEEVLQANTYCCGEKSSVADVITGKNKPDQLTGMAGVANIGSAINWTGHPFGQANWYGFGRQAWNPELPSSTIAEEWLKQTFSNEDEFVKPVTDMMITSREAVVNYMTPYGLHHIMDAGHHYGPGPWISRMPRADWTSVYYHKAASDGIGFDRTSSGSDALAQYAKPIQKQYGNPKTIPDEYLLWFHHLPWDYKMKNGHTLWDALGLRYQKGVDQVAQMKALWEKMTPYVNPVEHHEVKMLLNIQHQEAIWWKNACMLYFQTFSEKQFPEGMTQPDKPLSYYQSLKFPYAPGN